MSDYLFKYRCRYCGEEFTESMTGNERLAFGCVIGVAVGLDKKEPLGPNMMSVHIRENHYGVADFIGCEIKEKDDE